MICEEMANAYQPYSSAEMLVIRHGLKDGVRPSYPLTTSTEFHIAFIGSMYCYSAWKAFLSALDILNWRIGKKDVVLNVVGSEINLRAFRPARAVFHGWRELPYIETLLAQCDLLYLPQPFEDWQRILAELSFPTKLSTYVTTGKPVLVHAPSYSSVSLFAKRHEMEPVTAELNPEKLAALLTLQFTNPSQVERYCEQSARIGSTSLGKQQFVDATRAFLR